jgi:hypothetical protein
MSANSVEQEVLAAEEARCKATFEQDVNALRQILHEDYTHVTGAGGLMNQQQYIEWVTALSRKHVRRDLKVRVVGDSALICGPLTNHFPDMDPYDTYATQVLTKENGKWRFRAHQFTPMT